MIRASLLGLLAATAALIPACATPSQPADELGQETAADGEDGKNDAVGAFTFYTLVADHRACSLDSSGSCGTGFFLARANRSTTQCGRGPAQSQCKITSIDWTPTAMPASVAKGYEDALANGSQPLVVKGNVVPAANGTGLTFAVSEIWWSSTPEFTAGVFTLVKDNGIRCITAPCPSLTEQRLNSNLSAMLTGLDWDPSGASQDEVERATSGMYDGPGLLVVGYRDYDSLGGKTRTVNRFFTKAPVPLH